MEKEKQFLVSCGTDEWYGEWFICDGCGNRNVRAGVNYCDECGKDVRSKMPV